MRRETPPLPDDGIYRTILLVLIGSILVGGAMALVGELVYHDEAISHFGGWVVVICGVLYFVFRWLGHREAVKRAAGGGTAGERRPGEWPPDEPDE